MQGFTLLEMLLSIGLIALLVAFSAPLYQSLQNRGSVEDTSELLLGVLRDAQTRAYAGDANAQWGVFVGTSTITLFQGDSFVSRVLDFDETYTFPHTISATGTREFVFTQKGMPLQVGTTTLSFGTQAQRDIVISATGVLQDVPSESGGTEDTSGPTQADSLVVDTTNIGTCCGGVWVRNFTLANSGTSTITIDEVTLSWSGGSATVLNRIYRGAWVYLGPSVPSNTRVDIADVVLSGGAGPLGSNFINFDGTMNGSTIGMVFHMVDGSDKTVSGLSL